jgi:glycerate kinase
VVIAPDKFKGSLTAAQVAHHLAVGVRSALSTVDVVEAPVADGGDGTLAAVLACGFRRVGLVASGPTGQPVQTAFATRAGVGVIELADVSGLARLPAGTTAPLVASSRGTGEVVAAALEARCHRVVIGLGGSACTDGGAGMVRALGARVCTAGGAAIDEGGGALGEAALLDLSALHPGLAHAQIILASDVDSPLLGPAGAARLFAPQKGATAEQVEALESALRRWADLVDATLRQAPDRMPPWLADRGSRPGLRDEPGAGAAGGAGFAAMAVLGARRRPGIDVILDLVGFVEQIRGADLVVTGEGSLDPQSLRGKAPIGVAARAAQAGVRTVAVCGRLALSRGQLAQAGLSGAYSLQPYERDLQRSMRDARPLLERVGRQIAIDHLAQGW